MGIKNLLKYVNLRKINLKELNINEIIGFDISCCNLTYD